MEKLKKAKNIEIPDVYYNRIYTGYPIFDDILLGLIPGEVIALDAERGTGKTQFCLQLLESLSEYDIGYFTNEEAAMQIAFNAKRIGALNVPISDDAYCLDNLLNAMEKLSIMVIDSFSMITTTKVRGQRNIEKYCIEQLVQQAKKTQCILIIILHQTKTKQSKGSSSIQHLVDLCMHIHKSKINEQVRIISTTKNRFGKTTSINTQMTNKGFLLHTEEYKEVKSDNINIFNICDWFSR